jgi:hypothetical protein
MCTAKLRAGSNFQKQFLTTLGPNGEQGELASSLGVPLEIILYKWRARWRIR